VESVFRRRHTKGFASPEIEAAGAILRAVFYEPLTTLWSSQIIAEIPLSLFSRAPLCVARLSMDVAISRSLQGFYAPWVHSNFKFLLA
jgi:hypothetical protein